MTAGSAAVLGLFVVVAPVWAALSAWTRLHDGEWAFTPRWHRYAVPLFRTFFIASLPLEWFVAGRTFIPAVFAIGTLATLGWLGRRAHYLATAPRPFAAEESVRYNLWYVANLAAFAIACHSFVCLAVMINVSIPLLLVRERYSRCNRSPLGGVHG